MCLGGIATRQTTTRIRHVRDRALHRRMRVLWRMNHATIFWEIGKYATVVLLLIALIRIKFENWQRFALRYFGLLVPSIVLSFFAFGTRHCAQEISFLPRRFRSLLRCTWCP